MRREAIITKVMNRLAIEREESKEVADNLKKIFDNKKKNEYLQNVVKEKALDNKGISELMYDLNHTHQMLNLKKPEKIAASKTVNEKLKKFFLKHFHVQEDELKILDKVIEEIIDENEVDGMSEYELCDIYDDKVYELQKKHPKEASKSLKDYPVLFKVRIKDVHVEINGKPDVLKGGKVCEVIHVEKGVYVTNEEYGSGKPQLIPVEFAEKIK
jgi:hypothetical protein